MRIAAACAAVKLDKNEFLEEFFKTEHHGIREGEETLTDVWFDWCARKMAKERGISPDSDGFDALIDEAWQTCPPDIMHDFRQSYNRQDKYRA